MNDKKPKPNADPFRHLETFGGSLTRHPHDWMLLTPGAHFVATAFDAWWLINLIAAEQMSAPVRSMPFQVWTLKSSRKNGKLKITCADGDFNVRLRRFVTNPFPHPGITLWVDDLVIHLPSEH